MTQGSAAVDLEPTEESLQISARVVVHLLRVPRLSDDTVGLAERTQDGLADAVGSSLAAVSHVVKRLAAGGLLVVEARHVPGRRRRVRVYGLTPEGERIGRYIVERMRLHPGSPGAPPPDSRTLPRSAPSGPSP